MKKYIKKNLHYNIEESVYKVLSCQECSRPRLARQPASDRMSEYVRWLLKICDVYVYECDELGLYIQPQDFKYEH